jgi:F-box protein 18 (helicase)
MELTAEQRDVVHFPLRHGEILRVIAFAGTGKTTTLYHFAQVRPQQRILYVAFNKSVQQEAERRFPSHVHCRTVHSLAWRAEGNRFRHKLAPQIRANQVMQWLDLAQHEVARFVIETLHNFMVSGDPRIVNEHIPLQARSLFPPNAMPDFVQLAKQLWVWMSDPQREDVPMLHDGYLKLFQLSNPRLPYHIILLDEAQDTNPVTAQLLLQQPCAKVMVGDPHQAIYQFRGAKDMLSQIPVHATRYLTQSFRFGPTIADTATRVLQQFKAERNAIRGAEKRDRLGRVLDGPFAYVARTNAALFEQATNYLGKRKLGFVGGVQGYQLPLITETWHLYNQRKDKIRDAYLRHFASFETMKEYATNVEDWELLGRCRLVEKHQSAIPDLVNDLLREAVPLEESDIQLTTVHKAKGLEFERVCLADDFPTLVREGRPVKREEMALEEVNMVYVAATRAAERLQPNLKLQEFLDL